jgi:hypothetical protein
MQTVFDRPEPHLYLSGVEEYPIAKRSRNGGLRDHPCRQTWHSIVGVSVPAFAIRGDGTCIERCLTNELHEHQGASVRRMFGRGRINAHLFFSSLSLKKHVKGNTQRIG